MPDPQMPYYDPSQYNSMYNQPQMNYMPNDPTQAYNSYWANNQYLMNYGQGNLRATLQTAQYNFHQHMQNVLQGTMASAMAVYNTGKGITDKAREHVYQDMLLSQGNYALERSLWRDVAWGSGLAGSDFGRALKIGGRRPQFLSAGEYDFQMGRSWHHRQGELIDTMIGGGVAAGASALGMAVAGPLGLIGGLAVGYGIDQTAGKLIQPFLDRRAAVREMGHFTDITDLNSGVRQRRMSAGASSAMAEQFFEGDVSNWKYVPVVGDILAGRTGREIKYADTFKKMSEFNLFRDLNPDDIDKISDRVKKSVEVIDKYAGLLNTTRDAIIQIKGRFNQMGMSDANQNVALGNLANFTHSTGFSLDSALSMHGQFSQIGFQTGRMRLGYENLPGQHGLNEVASIKALQEGGMISRMYDPGSLGASFYMNAVRTASTGWGKVSERGNGNVLNAANFYSNSGGGSISWGMAKENLSMFANELNPLQSYDKNVADTMLKLREMGMSEQDIYAYLVMREGSPEGKEQAFLSFTGLRGVGMNLKAQSANISRLNKLGFNVRGGMSFGELLGSSKHSLSSNLFRSSDFTATETYNATTMGNSQRFLESLGLSEDITSAGNETLFNKYKKVAKGERFLSDAMTWLVPRSEYEEDINALYYRAANGIDISKDKEDFVKRVMNNEGVSREDALKIFNQTMKDREKDEGRISKFVSSAATASGTVSSFAIGLLNKNKSSSNAERELAKQLSAKLGKTEIDNIYQSIQKAQTAEEKESILRKAGLALDYTTLDDRGRATSRFDLSGSLDRLGRTWLYANDFAIGGDKANYLEKLDTFYKKIVTNDKTKHILGSSGMGGLNERLSKLSDEFTNIGSLKGDSLKHFKDTMQLIMGGESTQSDRFVQYLKNSSEEDRMQVWNRLKEMGFDGGSIIEEFEKQGKVLNSQEKAIEEFTVTLKALTAALTAN